MALERDKKFDKTRDLCCEPLVLTLVVQPCRQSPHVATATFNVTTKLNLYGKRYYFLACFYQYFTNVVTAKSLQPQMWRQVVSLV